MNEETNKNFTVEDYVDKLSKEEYLINFLKKHEICDPEKIDNICVYTKYKEYGRMIFSVHDGECYDVLIDIKAGEPSIEQVYNSVYGMGARCTKRIVMYGGLNENETYSPANGEMVVGSLVECMNMYESNISLIKMSQQEFRTEIFDLILNDSNLPPRFEIKNELPTLEQFRKAEFWNVYFDSLNSGFYDESKAFSGNISDEDNYGNYYEFGPFRIILKWERDGAFFSVTQIEGEIDILMNIWLKCKKVLKSKFQNLDIQFYAPLDKEPTITIKFWDFPISEVINATNKEKISYATLLHSRLWHLVSIFDEIDVDHFTQNCDI
jgi:hypothetical protein